MIKIFILRLIIFITVGNFVTSKGGRLREEPGGMGGERGRGRSERRDLIA